MQVPPFVQPTEHAGAKGVSRASGAPDICGRQLQGGLPEIVALARAREGALGEVKTIRSFRGKRDGLNWLKANGREFIRPAVLSFGIAVGPEEREAWKKAVRPDGEFDYVRECGSLNVTTACGVATFIGRRQAGHLIHVNKNFQDRYVILQVQCC